MRKKTAHVIGTNVSSSLSPTIFQYWFDKYSIDAEYGYIEIKEEKFDEEIKSILEEDGLCGLNITIPFKEKIISHLSKKNLNFVAKKIGAVNWICKTPIGEWGGHNSDRLGFQRSVEKHFIKKNTAIVIGYGGAAKAIIYSLINDLKYQKIKIFNRSFEKIKLLSKIIPTSDKEELSESGKENLNHKHIIEVYSLENLQQHIESSDLIINTTPTNILNVSQKWNINSNTTGFDVVYKPKGGTGFLQHFLPSKRIEGIHMLIHQAVPCFAEWFLVEPTIDEGLIKALYKKMEEK